MASEPDRAPVARRFRIFTVAVVSIWMLVTSVPSISRVWHPLGTFGYRSDSDGRVTQVATGSPADAAGLRVDDRFAVLLTPTSVRRYALGPLFVAPSAGVTISLPVTSGSSVRSIAMTAVPEQLSLTDKLVQIARALGVLIFCAVGAALVLLRPSVTTWAFFLYTIGLNPGSDATFDAALPPALYPVNWSLETLALTVGNVGFLSFALRFPADQLSGWRLAVGRAIPFAYIVLGALAVYSVLAPYLLGLATESISRVLFGAAGFVFLAGLAALVATYFRYTGVERQRITWVILGAAIGAPSYALATIFDLTSALPYPPYWVIGLLLSLNVLVPVAIAYAVIRHHVIDVSFVISRALVYAVLTGVLVGAFALADWLLGRELSSSGLAVAAEVGISIAFAFWLNSLHRRVDRFVDSTLFRARHLAERRLERVARALPHARSHELVSELLVREPIDALGLASAALFRRTLDDVFVRDAAVGWDDFATEIDPADTLVVHLEAEQTSIDIHDVRWTRADVPAGAAHPHLAVPIIVRRRLVGFILFGGHVGGVALDPDEVRIIGGLMTGAGAAYDHLDAEAMRRDSAALREQAATLARRVTELEAELDKARTGAPKAELT